MDNKDLYKNTINKISAPEDLKEKTLKEINSKRHEKISYMKFLAACAVFVLITTSIFYVTEKEDIESKEDLFSEVIVEENDQRLANLPTFKDIEELKAVLKENIGDNYRYSSKETNMKLEATAELADAADLSNQLSNSAQSENIDYSTTNIQVEGVDEADIVKTNGKYIYYLSDRIVHIIKADTLEEVNYIDYDQNENLNINFSPFEMYLNKDKLVVVGNEYSYEMYQTRTENTKLIETEDAVNTDVAISSSKNFAKAIIYDISNPKEIKITRELKIDGSYTNSRMIGNNLYFISTKYPVYYDGIKNEEILPRYVDNSKESFVSANKIVYFDGTDSYNYVIIAGVDISKNEQMHVESFFGSWTNNIYVSQDNLYIPISKYGLYSEEKNEIYKFNLKDSYIEFIAKGSFDGYLNSQFSIDEYNDYLRIATTVGHGDEAVNNLYILNNNLEEVSKITDIAKGEKIYSVRFMGKIGYIVTFEQIDPLFVVDLSDPYNPEIKGELKIPGYSSYLHPYDETHIIGIGHNVKSNGYGGVTNDNMKMTMFDVSDLSNPKEMFSVNIGEGNVYSEIEFNHKALFYNKNKNLIGFPLTQYKNYSDNDMFVLYHINLEKGFEEAGKISQKYDYKTKIKRAIFVANDLFTLSDTKIVKYNLDSIEKLQELELYKNN